MKLINELNSEIVKILHTVTTQSMGTSFCMKYMYCPLQDYVHSMKSTRVGLLLVHSVIISKHMFGLIIFLKNNVIFLEYFLEIFNCENE